MDDDMNATPLSKLPPPMVQSRRPEPPQSMSPGGPSDGGRKSKEVSAPTYAELLREMDAVAPQQQQQEPVYDDAYDERHYRPPVEVNEPSRAPPPRREIPPAAPRPVHCGAPVRRGGPVWRHRYTILVAVIVLVMLLYGIPKLQVAAPSLFSPMTMYKLNVTGAAVVAASAAGIYATLSTYVV